LTAPRCTRRQILGATTAMGGVLVCGVGLADPASPNVGTKVLWSDPRILAAQVNWFAANLPGGVFDPVSLDLELVRQWRDGLRRRLEAGPAGAFLVRSDFAILLRGLLREASAPAQSRYLQNGLHLITAQFAGPPS
jgi:hypothetical protein